MIRKTLFSNNEVYHICNRSVEGRNIFHTKAHVTYFLKSLIAANTTLNDDPRWRRSPRNLSAVKQDPLVKIYCLSLLPNHFHLCMKQVVDGGIPRLLQRICNSFAKYFNLVEERRGALFMGRFRATHVLNDVQASHVITYIHANSLDLRFPQWREGKIKDWRKAESFLQTYTYSSLPLYMGSEKSHPLIADIVTRDFVDGFYPTVELHLQAIKNWSVRNKQYIEHPL